jgi:SAM-dependent methyltransferase
MSAEYGSACEICDAPLLTWRLGVGDELGRCPSCGHVVRDLVRCPAGSRDRAWGGEAEMDRVRLALTYRRLRGLAGPGLRTVFEAGFGSGALLRKFADSGVSVAGADPGGLGVRIDPVVLAGGALTFGPVEEATGPPGGYTLVIAIHVVEHVPDPAGFVAACASLLAPAGRLVLVTPAGDSAGLRRFGASWWMLEDPSHVRFFSARSLGLLLAQAGLSQVSIERPVTDSLGVEAASSVRRLRRAPAADGVLPSLGTRLAVLASLPVVLPARAVSRQLRPTLQAVARPAAP